MLVKLTKTYYLQKTNNYFYKPKFTKMTKTKLLIVLSAFILLLNTSCKKDAPVNNTVFFVADLAGSKEVPANPSNASGNATIYFNTTTKILTATVTYFNITPSAAHIHKAAVGVNGGVVFGFSGLTNPIQYTSVALDATQEADLMNGNYYVNLHTPRYPGGEIRGQVVKL